LSYGRSGRCLVAGLVWRCSSTKPTGPESTETCLAGGRVVRITWTD
jgi:hypothetical protein